MGAPNTQKIKKFLDIDKHTIKTKENAGISINLNDFKELEETIIEIDGKKVNTLVLPGFFEVTFPDKMDSITFTFPYNININISEIQERTSQIINVSFKPGEVIAFVEVINTNTDMRLLESMFEGSIKYLNKDIYKRITSTFDQMQKINDVQLAHIELIYSQLYMIPMNGEYLPLRLTGKEYKPEYLINTKNSSQLLNNMAGMSYGFTNDFLTAEMTKKKRKAKSDMEHIMSNTYNQLQSKISLGEAPKPFESKKQGK